MKRRTLLKLPAVAVAAKLEPVGPPVTFSREFPEINYFGLDRMVRPPMTLIDATIALHRALERNLFGPRRPLAEMRQWTDVIVDTYGKPTILWHAEGA